MGMVGEIITITWKNKNHGKPRILLNGDKWEVVRVADSVLFSKQPGPWLLLKSVETVDCRWVHQTDDPNFKII